MRNIEKAVAFRTAALSYKLKRPTSEGRAMLVPEKGSGIQLSLKLTTSRKLKRHHPDLFAKNQEQEVKRLLNLGATVKKNWRYEDGVDYVVLTDAEGNSFLRGAGPMHHNYFYLPIHPINS